MDIKFVTKRFYLPLLAIVVLILMIAQFHLSKTAAFPPLKVSAQSSALNINHQLINTFHLGQRRMIGSLIWIETLLNSDLEHYNVDDLNSWMYQRFNALIELDPNFYEVYRYGGQYLSIVKDDEIGAEDIYRRGLQVFPDDFWLNYHAGFHYYFEKFEDQKALPLFEKIAFTKEAATRAPFLASLVTKMHFFKKSLTEDEFNFVYSIYKMHPQDSPISHRLFPTLYSIRCQIDLKCLNQKGLNCRTKDLEGTSYHFDEESKAFSAAKNCDLKIKRRRN